MKEQAVVEAALYSSGNALTVEDLARVTRLDGSKVRDHLKRLAKEYDSRGSALEVAQIGTKWAMQIRPEYSERARPFAPPEIDRDILKTAALVAYHQPLLQSDLFDMIGSKVYEHTQSLEKLGLINRKPSGRSLALTTTRYFSEFFGLKATDREGIRKLMASKAGIQYTERAAGPSPDVHEQGVPEALGLPGSDATTSGSPASAGAS